MNIQEVEAGNNEQIARVAVNTYRQIEIMEEVTKIRYNRHPAEHLDIDIAPKHVGSIEPIIISRTQARRRLVDLLSLVDPSTHDGEFIRAKLYASLVYFEELEVPGSYTPDEYTNFTNGDRLRKILQRQIDSQHSIVKDLTKDVGGVSYDPRGLKKYIERSKVDPSDVIPRLQEHQKRFMPVIQSTLDRDDFKPEYEVKKVEENKPWFCWVSGDRNKGMLVRVNLHPRHYCRCTNGALEILMIHEGDHIMQAEMVRGKELNPIYLATTVPSPEQIGLEGTAVVLPDLLDEVGERLSDAGRLELESRYLHYMVYNNVHVTSNQGRLLPEKELIQAIQYYLPGETEERIREAVLERAVDPKYRSYHGAYERGTFLIRQLIKNMSSSEKITFFKILHEHSRTPKQILDVAGKIIKSSSKTAA